MVSGVIILTAVGIALWRRSCEDETLHGTGTTWRWHSFPQQKLDLSAFLIRSIPKKVEAASLDAQQIIR